MIRNGITLLSGIDPVKRCERIIDAVTIQDRTLYFCPSPLYGYGLKRLLVRLKTEAPNSAVLCIEADNELYELAKENIDILSGEYPSFIFFTNVCETKLIYSLVRQKWGPRAFRRIETVRLNGGWQLFPQLYSSLCQVLRNENATDWSNSLTLAKLGRLYISNFIKNLSLITKFPSIEHL
jgi:hypothetical protein